MKYTEFLLYLRQHGYRESGEVLASGDIQVLGDTIVWWPPTETSKYRYHFFGEDLERAERQDGEQWMQVELIVEPVPNQLVTQHGTVRSGEYIVHPSHGVGIFESVVSREVEGVKRQFISLRYAGNDLLLFPFERNAELMPYIGSRHPRLTRLYSKSWQNTKERVQRDLIGVARGLLKIFAERHLSDRPPYAKQHGWADQIARSLGFELTEDQARAVADIRRDLEVIPHPMDRLVCGDVGFGKTEVAMRIAAQVLEAGKQIALVAPTTVLAEQHYTMLVRRFADLPVKVAHLSRLTSAATDKETIAGLENGTLDVIVGTHRVFGKDIVFKDLGLLIIDEEQKFGVAHKERLKQLRPSIDVLSLSATPIPRTLSMSLSGLRGLSILRTPPHGRLPVKTNIQEYDEDTLREAIVAELERGGQTYVVHNRVQSLGVVREKVLELLTAKGVPAVRYEDGVEGVQVALAHGQMDEKLLAKTMSDFLSGNIHVLCASSIVEHGLDSPGANTLVVLHAEWFGLSDLYQLRGRVGRRQQQAHAYFLLGGVERNAYRDSEEKIKVSEDARRRLEALKEADELGSGWSVALRDLEIRGGGNILGNEQHGSMESIGLLLYAQLLQEEIGRQAALKGIKLFQPLDGME